MKIKKLQIKNFQSHKDATLEFDDGLNIIVGPTNTGKSSIIRALKKVIRDTPGGNNFVNVDEKECTISIATEDSEIDRRIVVSSKGETKVNEYVLNGTLFAKFGKEVPTEIKQALRMAEVDFGAIKLDLNFADQLEGPFLLASPPSLKAKVLGKLTGVDVLDTAIICTNRKVRKLVSDSKDLGMRIETTEKELSEFIDIQKCEKDLQNIKQMIDEVEKNIDLVNNLQSLKSDLDSVVLKGKDVKNRVKNLSLADDISLEVIEKDIALLEKVKGLRNSKINYDETEKALLVEISQINSLSDIKLDSIEIDIGLLQQIQGLKQQTKVFKDVILTEENISNLDNQINDLVTDLKTFLSELKICPVCYRRLSDDVIDKIVEEGAGKCKKI